MGVIGPGTFEFWWARHGTTPSFVRDAHSLYFETLAETGLVGVAMLIGLLLFVLATAVARSLRGRPGMRIWIAAAVGGLAAFMTAAAFEWVWEMGAIACAVMLLAAVILVGRDEAPVVEELVASARPRFPRIAVTVLAVVALGAITVPMAGVIATRDSRDAIADGRVDAALQDSRTAERVQPYAATAHLQRALVLEQAGSLSGAAAAAKAATADDRRTGVRGSCSRASMHGVASRRPPSGRCAAAGIGPLAGGLSGGFAGYSLCVAPARPETQDLGSVAIVHDYLNQRGGAERVVLEMASIWPQAPIYTSLFRPDSTFPEFRALDVRTSLLDRLPVDGGFRNLFPLYPAAFRAFGKLSQNVVISSSSGWAHGVRTRDDSFHAVYCYTPARWLYGGDHLGTSRRQLMLRPGLALVRRWDRAAACRADLYIAISNAVRDRIKQRYGLEAPVVYPPVDVDRFRPCERGERLLVVSRLLPYKRVDVIVDAATTAGIGLDVVGAGPSLDDLRRRAGPTVEFHGRLPDSDVTALMEGCRAFCLPGTEDFGITPVEANAAGKPVVALGAGGALETLEDGISGSFFSRQEPADLLAAIDRCDRIDTAPEVIAGMARRFSAEAFRERLLGVIETGMARPGASRRAVERRPALKQEASPADAPHRRMRVVYLDHVAQLSGGEIALLRLLPHLDDVEPHVILAEDGPFAGRLAEAEISTEVLPMGARARGLRKDRVTVRTLPLGVIASTAVYVVRLAIHLRRLRPDLVHTNSLKSGLYGCVAARLIGIPAVWHVRDRIAEDYLPKPAVRLIRSLTRWLPSVVITNSDETMRTLDPHVAPFLLYFVLPEVLVAPEAQFRREGQEIVVGMIGRLAPWKGQELVLRAFAEAFPAGGARCVLVGSAMFGEEVYAARLTELVSELQLEDRVEFRGFRTDIWAELGGMDILVHASLIPEPFGQVILEGMAAGVPVVAADAGGPAEIVRHEGNGLLYAMGSRAALAAVLRQLAHDRDLRARLSAGGLATVATYHPDAVVPLLQTLYRDVIDRSNRGRARRAPP